MEQREEEKQKKGGTKLWHEITTCHLEDCTLSYVREANVKGLKQSRSCPPVLLSLSAGV